MVKSKKHSRPTLEDALAQPWCYYCEKIYADVGALLSHQKDKHFQCPCRRRLNTAGGLKVHMAQVHKQELMEVPNALDHRKDPSVEVFTMYGIPEDILQQRRQEIEAEFFREEHERRLRTGNPTPGTSQPGAVKKAKTESSDSLKARVAQRRAENAARKAAEAKGSAMPSNLSPATSASHVATAASSPGGIQVPGLVGNGSVPSPLPMNGSSPFAFHAGQSPFSPPSSMSPALPQPPAQGRSLPPHPSANLPNPASYSRGPSNQSPISNFQSQHYPLSHNGSMSNGSIHAYPGHATLPPQPQFGAPRYSSTLPLPISTSNATAQVDHSDPDEQDGSSDQDDENETSTPPVKDMSLLKLCIYGLNTIRSKARGQDGSDTALSTTPQYPESDLALAICDKVYGSASTSSLLSAKAEDILRGFLNLNIDKTLPVNSQYADKLSMLKTETNSATLTSNQAQDTQTSKKKDPEKSKLADNGLSWEEQHSQSRKDTHPTSGSTQATGPVNDAVTGVVGDGEVGSSVMEE